MTHKNFLIFFILSIFIFLSCTKDKDEEKEETSLPPSPLTYISGADLSFLPMLESNQTKFYNKAGEEKKVLDLFKERGMNTVRIRLWHQAVSSASSFAEVKAFSEDVRSKGMKVWLTVHYSDTWADPGHQETPSAWSHLPFELLKDSVYRYTKKIMDEINPDIIQIGNEINGGMLWPQGKIMDHKDQFLALLASGAQAVRESNAETKIMIHFAGIDGSEWFYDQVRSIDYDLIGISYYPWWHGKDMNALKTSLSNLKQKYGKGVVIAETSYPFTLGWNDWTNNVVGNDEHLIWPDFPATQQGQRDFLLQLKELIENAHGFGFCLWAPDWVAWDGPESQIGSSWENQALFDFENKETLATEVFQVEKR